MRTEITRSDCGKFECKIINARLKHWEKFRMLPKLPDAGQQCEVKAIGVATHANYVMVRNALFGWDKTGPSINKFMLSREFNGYRFKLITLPDWQSPQQFVSEHPNGRYVLFYKHGPYEEACHYIPVIDGVIYDYRAGLGARRVPYAFKAVPITYLGRKQCHISL